MMGSSLPTVAVIEDDPVVANYLADLIGGDDGLRLIGTASSLAEARALLDDRPDLVLLDIDLPDGSGIELLEARAQSNWSSSKFLLLTLFGDEKNVTSAIRAGAEGYLLKDVPAEQLRRSLSDVLSGGVPLSASVAAHLLRSLRTAAHGAAADNPLTPREVQLLRLFAAGRTNKEAAREIGLSPHTVNDYVKAIYRKLQAGSRAEAVSKAIAHRLLAP